MEPAEGVEPTAGGLRNRCSTTELRWQNCISFHVPDDFHDNTKPPYFTRPRDYDLDYIGFDTPRLKSKI